MNNANSSFKIYVLRLENGKYYVGKTERPVNDRFNEHRDGIGSAWTKLYKPIEIFKIEPKTDTHTEDNVTLEYMEAYGTENVRGGMYSQIKLTLEQKDAIVRQNRHRNDQCMECGLKGHFSSSCPNKKVTVIQSSSINPDTITIQQNQKKQKQITNPHNKKRSKENDNDETFDRRNQKLSKSSNMYLSRERTYNNTERATATTFHGDKVCCPRCGRSNHGYEECYASKDVNGCKLDSSDSGYDSEDYNITVVPTNRSSSVVAPPKKKKKENTNATRNQKLSTSSSVYIPRERTYNNTERATATTDIGCCQRCGRSNHGYEKCYASKDVNGCKLDSSDSEDYNITIEPTNRSSSFGAPKKKKKENTTATATTRTRKRTSTSTTKGCIRCGRSSHKVDKCYALSDVDGNILPDDFYDF